MLMFHSHSFLTKNNVRRSPARHAVSRFDSLALRG
jgi:hypothetical protein